MNGNPLLLGCVCGCDCEPRLPAGPERQMTPPRSPDLAAERGKEFKENKEPSPKVRRRKSIKISSVALEQAQWQNDSLQILTSAGDYKCMNEFLQKKVSHWALTCLHMQTPTNKTLNWFLHVSAIFKLYYTVTLIPSRNAKQHRSCFKDGARIERKSCFDSEVGKMTFKMSAVVQVSLHRILYTWKTDNMAIDKFISANIPYGSTIKGETTS